MRIQRETSLPKKIINKQFSRSIKKANAKGGEIDGNNYICQSVLASLSQLHHVMVILCNGFSFSITSCNGYIM